MKIHLIKKQTIQAFTEKYASSKNPFAYWLAIIKLADWNEPADIMATFGSADLLGNGSNRVVFDIAGNNFRMICKYLFGEMQVHLFICWIGTHAEYTKVCKEKEQYTINNY
jgi:mRNA interferase HigB